VFLGQADGPLVELARLGGPLLVTAGVYAAGVALATGAAWLWSRRAGVATPTVAVWVYALVGGLLNVSFLSAFVHRWLVLRGLVLPDAGEGSDGAGEAAESEALDA